MKLNVSAIQHFSTGDGPGIRTTVFLKGCNLRCPWCHNPETIAKEQIVLRYKSGDVISGELIEIDDIISEAMEDVDFYGTDGGVTISGGEPMLQSDGVAYLARRLKELGVSSIIDTAGCVPYSHFEKLTGVADTFFIDLKAASEEDYDAIGGNFKLVTDNIRRLISGGFDVRIRIPLIPDFNTMPEYSERMCELIKSLGAQKLDLLPFHRLGSGKYDGLGIPYKYKNQEPMTVAQAKEISKIYAKYFDVQVEK